MKEDHKENVVYQDHQEHLEKLVKEVNQDNQVCSLFLRLYKLSNNILIPPI